MNNNYVIDANKSGFCGACGKITPCFYHNRALCPACKRIMEAQPRPVKRRARRRKVAVA
jgi:hypothetical protein